MIGFTSILCLALPLAASAAPIVESQLKEDKPWILTDISVFTANKASPATSYINLKFTDANKGLKLTTQCSHFVLPGSGENIAAGTTYPCANSTVGFSYTDKTIKVQRTYRDDSVGPPPYNYVTAFGEANVTFTPSYGKSDCGSLKTLKKLEVPITALIA